MDRELDRGGFLVVDDQQMVARAFANVIRQHAHVEIVPTIRDAEAALRQRGWCGVVLDVALPDGSGLELLARMRKGGSRVPVLVATGAKDFAVANIAHRLDASCVFKPDVMEDLLLFVSRARTRATRGDERTAVAVARLQKVLRLSRREAQIAELVAQGIARSQLAGVLGVSENTIKTTVRSLLNKFCADRVDGVARAVLEEVVHLSAMEESA